MTHLITPSVARSRNLQDASPADSLRSVNLFSPDASVLATPAPISPPHSSELLAARDELVTPRKLVGSTNVDKKQGTSKRTWTTAAAVSVGALSVLASLYLGQDATLTSGPENAATDYTNPNEESTSMTAPRSALPSTIPKRAPASPKTPMGRYTRQARSPDRPFLSEYLFGSRNKSQYGSRRQRRTAAFSRTQQRALDGVMSSESRLSPFHSAHTPSPVDPDTSATSEKTALVPSQARLTHPAMDQHHQMTTSEIMTTTTAMSPQHKSPPRPSTNLYEAEWGWLANGIQN
eukprot:CAMPEP_0172465302 /NCGR_PEP_ID=MMETSP1065-20121228/53105_1 /TAXON_ID=265537 /ORGANISM="Amphiprora paludosa, Strain CCMP125" /LENGTH=290 /DNA_ID=CAMNT_0013221793 /DNA_START=24 /DNA_END=896 /DNA_ORIENTATION=-